MFNKELCKTLIKRKLNKLYFAEIEYYNNQLIIYMKGLPNENTFPITEVHERSKVICLSTGKYKTKSNRLSKKLENEMNHLFVDNPSSIIFKLVKVSANVLFFEYLNSSQNLLMGNPAETMSKILGDAILNDNLIKDMVIDNNIMTEDND